MGIACVQDIYRCDICKSASDEYGRGCKHGMFFPLLLAMTNSRKCEHYEFAPEKAEIHLQRKDNDWVVKHLEK
ncbi:hypothetical protein F3F90_02565 [Bacteroides salyersiae]|uniref:Uncharacterized protein n=1 Tax=Bacteroides salyersiae TaxID=291644 RepID=A0A7J4XM68_9BACE|nr:hypothetical protein F3F90_02565 [Bacteroides salyersiae]KAA3695154.1 hypothetical protein F3F88_16980 [Bacteroides salyersiae]KAA3698122.1 hypothetical protein F3F89_06920 [Bacteroides salyersiae]KAA3704014.1 hypothetical protein F3F83_18550 [Bacteroides salyersiae]KAA3709040.1 hypothetical protein F3G09_13580 [Bacteroides salyersiae]